MEPFIFPSDRAKVLRGSPDRWYQLAKEYLPMPAAFREGAKALRAQIRTARKEGEDLEPYLTELFRLACLHSLLNGEKGSRHWRGLYSEPLPPELWDDFSPSYGEVGHEHLPLLGVTDRKWIESQWGPAERHVPVWSLRFPVEDAMEEHFQGAWEREEERDRKRRDEILAAFDAPRETSPRGCGPAVLLIMAPAFGSLLLTLM